MAAPIPLNSTGGPPRAWEGSDQPTPYSVVNTKTGHLTTVLPLTGWKGRGLSVNLTLFHTDDVPNGTSDVRGHWTNTYTSWLEGVSDGWVLHEGDGTPKKFTGAGSPFQEEPGFFDKLTFTETLCCPHMEMTVTRKNGTRYIYSTPIMEAIPAMAGATETGTAAKRQAEARAAGYGANPNAGTILRLQRIVDRNGNEINLTYQGGTGKMESVTDPTGRALTFSYPNSSTTVITDPTGQTWTLDWSGGSLGSVVSAAPGETSRTFSFGYSGSSVASLADWKTNAEHPGQATWAFTYVNSQITQAVGPAWMANATRPKRTYEYTSPNGYVATNIRSKTGVDVGGGDKYLCVTHDYTVPVDPLTQQPEPDYGNLAKVTRWPGGTPGVSASDVTHVFYGDTRFVHLPDLITDGSHSHSWQYNDDANPTEIDTTAENTTVVYGDALNPNLPTEVHRDRGSAAYEYDSHGNLTDAWDANHLLNGSADPAKSHGHYTYDTHGKIIEADPLAAASPSGKSWIYTYDANGNLNTIQRPGESSASQTIHYDTLSHRDWSTRFPTDPHTTYGYDGFGRLETIDYPAGNTPDISYTHNANDALTGMTDATGVTIWDLDALDQPLDEKKGTLNPLEVDWSYDAAGRRTSMTNWHPAGGIGEVMNYNYVNPNGEDWGSLVSSVSGPWGNDGGGNPLQTTFDFCSCGQLLAVHYPYQIHRVDSEGDLGPPNPPLASPDIYGYTTYDPQWNAIAWEQDHTGMNDATPPPALLQGLVTSGPDGYSRDQFFLPYTPTGDPNNPPPTDQMNRLLHEELTYEDWPTSGVSTSALKYDYTLGDVSNRTQLKAHWNISGVDQVDTYAYTYDSAGKNRLTNISVGYPTGPTDPYWTDVTYDSAGNTSYMDTNTAAEEETVTLGYSGANQLTSVVDNDSGGTTVTVQFVYDGLGRLAQKKDGSGNVLATYYYDGSALACEITPTGTVTYQWANGRALSQRPTVSGMSHTYWYMLDVLGNVKSLVDGSQNILKAVYVYDGFGNLQPSSFEDLDIENPLRYRANSGYLFLMEPQQEVHYALYNAGARTFNTDTGRWLQEDPVVGIPSDPMSFNRYLYCNADPINNTDPTGLNGTRSGRIPPGLPTPAPGVGNSSSVGRPNDGASRMCVGYIPCPNTVWPVIWSGVFSAAGGVAGAAGGGGVGSFVLAGVGGMIGSTAGEELYWNVIGRPECFTSDRRKRALLRGVIGGAGGALGRGAWGALTSFE